MPVYEYKCPNGHLFEVIHGMTVDGPTVCEVCGEGPLQRVLHPVAVHYKGSGFYSTDYGRKKKSTGKDGGSDSGSDSGSSSGSDSGSSGDSGSSSGDSGSSSGGSSSGTSSSDSSGGGNGKKKAADG